MATETETVTEQKWIPLESNPEVMNKYVHSLGVPKNVKYVDVYGLDDELLEMIPKTVLALTLLYPLSDKTEQSFGEPESTAAESVYFIKQTISNACGTIAMVHSLANNKDQIEFDDNLHFSKFLAQTADMKPLERAEYLENDKEMGSAHEASAQEGQTQAPPPEEDNKRHFVTFVHANGILYEMDGRIDTPIAHGPTAPENFLKDAVQVVKKFIERDPEEVNFSVMALVKEDE